MTRTRIRPHPDEAEDFANRGQELQDQEDLLAGRLPSEADLTQEPTSEASGTSGTPAVEQPPRGEPTGGVDG